MIVKDVCSFWKLAQGSSLQSYVELFATRTNVTNQNVIHGTCRAIYIALHHEISQPIGEELFATLKKLLLKAFVVSLEFVGVIDGTFILIAKPRNSHEDYSI